MSKQDDSAREEILRQCPDMDPKSLAHDLRHGHIRLTITDDRAKTPEVEAYLREIQKRMADVLDPPN